MNVNIYVIPWWYEIFHCKKVHIKIIEQFCSIINHLANSNDAIIGMIGHYTFDKVINNTINPKYTPFKNCL